MTLFCFLIVTTTCLVVFFDLLGFKVAALILGLWSGLCHVHVENVQHICSKIRKVSTEKLFNEKDHLKRLKDKALKDEVTNNDSSQSQEIGNSRTCFPANITRNAFPCLVYVVFIDVLSD